MNKLETVQKDFTNLILEIGHLSYCKRLKRLRLTLIQHRFNRYRGMYTIKILMGLVPNVGLTVRTEENLHLGNTLEAIAKEKDPK